MNRMILRTIQRVGMSIRFNKMTNAKTPHQIGEISPPRFEFRTFGYQLDASAKLMADASIAVPEAVRERSSDELYIVSKTNDSNNTKIRNGHVDIKTLIQTVDGCEQWKPQLKTGFPIVKEVLVNDLFPAFMVEPPALRKESYTLEEFLTLVRAHPKFKVIKVHKHRHAYNVNNTICEVAKVVINGVHLKTISTESTVLADVKKTIEAVGLTGVENINYVQAIKRIIKWENKPLAT